MGMGCFLMLAFFEKRRDEPWGTWGDTWFGLFGFERRWESLGEERQHLAELNKTTTEAEAHDVFVAEAIDLEELFRLLVSGDSGFHGDLGGGGTKDHPLLAKNSPPREKLT